MKLIVKFDLPILISYPKLGCTVVTTQTYQISVTAAAHVILQVRCWLSL